MAYNSFINKQAGTQSPKFEFKKDRTNATIVSGDGLGEFNFRAFDGTSYIDTSRIISVSSGTIAANRIGSNLEFWTHPDSVTASTQRMVISSEGNVEINAPVSGSPLALQQDIGGNASINISQSSADSFTAPIRFFKYRGPLGNINSGDSLGEVQYFGRAGGVTDAAAIIQAQAGTITGAFVPSFLKFYTKSTTNVLASRLEIAPDGNVTVNAPAATGQALTVNAFGGTANYAFVTQAAVSGGLLQAGRFLNTSTTAGSGSRLDVSTNQQPLTTGGDPFIRFTNEGLNAISIGWDTSTQQYAMSSGSALGSGNFFTWTLSNNQINLPLQASFLEILTTDALNQTGNGAIYKLIGFTEIYDQSNSFNTVNGEFTAPATGRYMLTAQVRVYSFTGATGCQLQLVTSNRTYYSQQVPTSSNGFFSINIAVNADMDQGDIAYVRVQITGLAGDTADISSDGANGFTWFSGCLLQ